MSGSLDRLRSASRALRARHQARAWRFGLVGLSGLAVNTLALAVATGAIGIHYLIGVVVATQASTLWNFVLTDRWVFSDRRSAEGTARRFGSFWLVNNSALALRAPLVALLTSGIGIHYLISNLVSLLILFVLRYAVSEAWIWRAGPAPTGRRPLSWRAIAALGAALVMVASLVGVTAVARQENDPPKAPTGVTAVAVGTGEVALAWSPPRSRSVVGYQVLRDNQVVAELGPESVVFMDTSVAPATAYAYTVAAQYRGRGVPVASAQVGVKTPELPDLPDDAAPTSPEGLTVTPVDTGMLLDWYDAIDDSDVTAYEVSRDGQQLAVLNGATLSYLDGSAPDGATVTYTVVAHDPAGNTSAPAAATVIARGGPALTEELDGTLGDDEPAAAESPAAFTTLTSVSPSLRRYPYLTDLVGDSVIVNWATDRSARRASAAYGQVGVESCDARPVTATRTAISVNSVRLYQWKATLDLTPGVQYCYRVFLDGEDLLGSDPAPTFWPQVPAGATEPFTFAVFGDWGSVGSDGTNDDQANVMAQVAASGARFAVTTGDNAYPSGTHNNYGDLVERGPGLSAVFAPEFWARAGASIPLFPAMGNHGFASTSRYHPHLTVWPQDQAVATSGGRYERETRCCLNGTKRADYPSAWYAFDAGVARIYVLQSAWASGNVGSADAYKNDYDHHWAPTTDQYQWLANDLAAHPDQLKFAFFHYPLYSDSRHEVGSPYLLGEGSLEGLLAQHGVNLAFNGHAHLYQRNISPGPASLATHIAGGGGAKLGPIEECSSVDAYGVGWSYSANNGAGRGSACGAATPPTARDQVFHFLLVRVDGQEVTVTPVDSLGRTFDAFTYDFSAPPPPPPPAAVFYDDFEFGNMSRWNTSGGLTVQGDVVHAGSFAARGNTTTGRTYAKKTLPDTYTTGYARVYVNLTSASSQVNLIRLRTANGASIGYLYVRTDGRLALRNIVGKRTFTSATTLPAGWHSLELRMTIDGEAGATEVWLDGARVDDLSVTTNLGSDPIGRLQIGEVQSGRTYDVTFDDVVFDGAPIGP